MKIVNSFSLNMLDEKIKLCNVTFKKITSDEVRNILTDSETIESYVGHEDTARLFSSILNTEIKFNRGNLKIGFGDKIIVGQYKGPRLPEGCHTLPEGASIEWYLVSL